MLILQGILRAATIVGGGTNKKTGEVIPERPVLQIETTGRGGLVEMHTITVPAVDGFKEKVGKQVNVLVRAWAPGAKVGFVLAEPLGAVSPAAA